MTHRLSFPCMCRDVDETPIEDLLNDILEKDGGGHTYDGVNGGSSGGQIDGHHVYDEDDDFLLHDDEHEADVLGDEGVSGRQQLDSEVPDSGVEENVILTSANDGDKSVSNGDASSSQSSTNDLRQTTTTVISSDVAHVSDAKKLVIRTRIKRDFPDPTPRVPVLSSSPKSSCPTTSSTVSCSAASATPAAVSPAKVARIRSGIPDSLEDVVLNHDDKQRVEKLVGKNRNIPTTGTPMSKTTSSRKDLREKISVREPDRNGSPVVGRSIPVIGSGVSQRTTSAPAVTTMVGHPIPSCPPQSRQPPPQAYRQPPAYQSDGPADYYDERQDYLSGGGSGPHAPSSTIHVNPLFRHRLPAGLGQPFRPPVNRSMPHPMSRPVLPVHRPPHLPPRQLNPSPMRMSFTPQSHSYPPHGPHQSYDHHDSYDHHQHAAPHPRHRPPIMVTSRPAAPERPDPFYGQDGGVRPPLLPRPPLHHTPNRSPYPASVAAPSHPPRALRPSGQFGPPVPRPALRPVMQRPSSSAMQNYSGSGAHPQSQQTMQFNPQPRPSYPPHRPPASYEHGQHPMSRPQFAPHMGPQSGPKSDSGYGYNNAMSGMMRPPLLSRPPHESSGGWQPPPHRHHPYPVPGPNRHRMPSPGATFGPPVRAPMRQPAFHSVPRPPFPSCPQQH